MKKLKFTKMVATGNDFIVIDNRKCNLKSNLGKLAQKLCDRKFGIGADGLILLEKSKKCDFSMRIFNPDGSEPDMCGNGSRCIALFSNNEKIAKRDMSIETGAGVLLAAVKDSNVKINMTDPKDLHLGLDFKIDNKTYKLNHINTGVPHVVCFADDIDSLDLFTLGRTIRYHRVFMPEGTNVNIVETKTKNSIYVRTYERGVESETLACGTGSVASAIISGITKGFKSPVKVHTKGGDLKIYFKEKNKILSNVFLEGRAQEVFKGEWRI